MTINNKVLVDRIRALRNSWSDIARYAAWLVLSISISITYLLWQNAHRSSIQEQRIEFESHAHDLEDRLYRRVVYYVQALHGVRAFYLNQHEMERSEFTGYISALEINKNYPGMQGVSFAPLVIDEKKREHISSLRRSGLPGYAIKPEGKRTSYAPVAFIEPQNERNSRALGFDNLSNPERKITIERARDEDHAVMSEKLILKQEDEQAQQAGFLVFLPVFHRGATHDTLDARRANIDGWFAASFRMEEMMAGLLDAHSEGINIEIFDGGDTSGLSRMYGFQAPAASLYTTTETIEIAGRKWSVRFSSLPDFELKRNTSGERDAVISGVLFAFLLSLAAHLFLRDRQRVLQMSVEIGKELEMRKQAEHKTDDLYRFNQAILDRSPAGIAVYMASGPCVMANEAYAKSIGGTVGDMLKQDFRNSDSWKRNGLLDFANQAFETGMTLWRDVQGVTSFGRKVVLECIFSPIDIAQKPHLLVITNDVSERAEAEQALTKSMRQLEDKELAKTRFLAAAGHDLRQPLAAANLFIDALKLTQQTPRQGEIIQRLDQSMATFNELLDALLNVSKLDAGMIKPEYAAISVSEMFNWLEQNFAPMASNKQLGFRLYFPMHETLLVRSDLGLLKSVLMNLVSNAIKFTAKGAVLISARRRGEEVLFQVWDTGIGITQEQIKRIFDEFYQVNNPQRDRSGGLGLGLAIARRALTLMGVNVSCRSQVGRGSVFEFRLPVESALDTAAQISTVENAPKEVANESFARGKRFVVVEDDKLVAQATCNWLEGMGSQVSCFHSAEEALRHASIEYADYYIADYMLGGELNGIQFLNVVRHKMGRPINAVVVTGDTSSDFIRHAVDCDWPVMYKPINTSQLISELSAQAQGARKSK